MLEHSPISGFSWIPPGEVKCVWMTAGVLTYKLCNQNLDCEHCALHNALAAGVPDAKQPCDNGNPAR